MDLLAHLDLVSGPDRLAILGCAKNAGKTTALVALLHALEQRRPDDTPPALLSIGVDGERRDAFSGAPKPAIPARAGTLCVTATAALKDTRARVTLLEDMGIGTPLGPLFIVRVEAPGDIRLAGIRHRADLLDAIGRLRQHGARRVLIDGAFDRLVAADPRASDGVLLATGAVLGPTVHAVARETLSVVQRLSLPKASAALAPLLEAAAARVPRALIADGLVSLSDRSLLLADEGLADLARHNPRAIELAGALSPRIADRLLQSGLRDCTLLLSDPTRALLPLSALQRLARRGLNVVVRRPIRLLGVVANPHAPGGVALDPRALCHALHDAMPHLPVVDVRSGLALSPRS